jgi:hypothetical protein
VTVRSAVLGRWKSVAGQNHLAFTVPPGMTALVKYANASNRSGAIARTVVTIKSPDTLVQVDVINVALQVVFEPSTWSGTVVVDANGSITFYCDQTGVDIWVSGSILQGVAPIPAAPGQLPSGGGPEHPGD